MFTQARIKLTAAYVLIIVCIISVFSLILFNYTVQHIHDNLEEDSVSQKIQERIIKNTVDQLQMNIIIADLIVILFSGLLSYWLASITLEPIQTALDAQEQFSAHASHELRTPLAVMKTENEVFLKDKQSSVKDAHVLASSNLEEINRMVSMVENLLVLARSKKTHVGMEMEKVNITEVLSRVANSFRKTAEVKGIQMYFTEHKQFFIRGNTRLLEQLFSNIIQNAINYSSGGKITITIESHGTNKIKISISDTGIGIAPKDVSHIFEPFYKADSSRNTSSGGVGLGLSIVKDIVEKHSGEISIQSELDTGTQVIVIFPTC